MYTSLFKLTTATDNFTLKMLWTLWSISLLKEWKDVLLPFQCIVRLYRDSNLRMYNCVNYIYFKSLEFRTTQFL